MATILVADDDQLLRAIIRDHLERAGHTILEAGDGIAAMEIALDERPECLLLDVMMPLARGLEVVRRVRLQQAAWYPAIVMISARTRVTDRLNALEAGADAYIEKPFAPGDLLRTITWQLDAGAPTRLVDVLGPVWATLALERLAEQAVTRRTRLPAHAGQLEPIFADLLSGSLGRADGAATAGPQVMRLLWEDAIRALLRDAAAPDPPSAGPALSAPDAIAAVERLIGGETLARHHDVHGHAGGLDAFWRGVIGAALAPARPVPDGGWTARLRQVLGHAEPVDGDVARWSAVLDGMLRGDAGPAAATIDPLGPVWLAMAGGDPVGRPQ